MSTALGSSPGGDPEDARFEAELTSRYEEDDDDATVSTPPAAAAGAENAPDAMCGAAVAGPAEDDDPGERGWADRMDEFPDDDGEEDEPYDEYDDEDGYDDDDIAAALESLDMRDDFAARGGHGAGGSGGLATSAWRPNANGGAGNHGSHLRASSHTKKSNETKMQHDAGKIAKIIKTAPLRAERLHDDFGSVGGKGTVGQKVNNSLRETQRKQVKLGNLTKDKEDRATVEQALDPRTRLILFKMLSHGVFKQIYGCISTGKEANVYHAVKEDGTDLAVKV